MCEMMLSIHYIKYHLQYLAQKYRLVRKTKENSVVDFKNANGIVLKFFVIPLKS